MERKSKKNIDSGAVISHSYNEYAGAQKNTEVGRHLKPLKSDATTFTTDATTARAIPPGRNLAVYNNAAGIGAVTLGEDATVTALAAGVTDAGGHVGIPCKPGDWTYIACYDKTFVKATASTLLVFLIEDDTSVK
jgi:hypothetical protein